jgi:tetratricopeptide (TPR) repeat protein
LKRAQWITVSVTLLLAIALYAGTRNQIFGEPRKFNVAAAKPAAVSSVAIDSFLNHVREHLTPDQVTRLNYLEANAGKEKSPESRLHYFHQLARYWRDSVRLAEAGEAYIPYAWYTAEASRLENSEKSLTFAARLFLSNLESGGAPELLQWQALQAKDLYERSLKINPDNDSSKIELGTLYVYGNIAMPMQGIKMITEVADKNPENVYAQVTLGDASMTSGQYDKAIDRFRKVVAVEPRNIKANLRLAEAYERKKDNKQAIEWYRKALPLVEPQYRKDIEQRIEQLNK